MLMGVMKAPIQKLVGDARGGTIEARAHARCGARSEAGRGGLNLICCQRISGETIMAVSKDEILDAIAKMSVIEVVELIADMEKKFGVTAAAPVAMAAGPAAGGCGGGSGRGADRVHRHAQGISGRQESDRHQGDSRDHRPGPEGSQGPGRGRALAPSRKAFPRPMSKPSRRSSKTPAPRWRSNNLHAAGTRACSPRSPAPRMRARSRAGDAGCCLRVRVLVLLRG